MQQLLQEIKRYFVLERRYWTLDLTEKLAKVIGVCVMLLIVLILGGIALFAGVCALALWLGGLTGSLALGFLSTGILVIVLAWIVKLKQEQWIAVPIARMILHALSDSSNPEDDEE